MARTIGSFSFITFLRGNQSAGEQLAEITRPGVDGVAFAKTGRRSLSYLVQTQRDVLDGAAAQQLMTDYKAIQGTLVTVVDAHGRSVDNVAVVEVREASVRPVKTLVGGAAEANEIMVSAEWTLRDTNVPA